MTLPANARIIDLPAGTTPSGSEPIETVQGGISVQLTTSQLVSATPAGTVTNAMLATAPALTVKGNPTNATASVQDVAGTANQVLRINSAGTSWSWGQVNLASSATVTGVLVVVNGGTGFGTYTLGDTLYSDATNSLAKLAGNITATRKFIRQTGNGAVSAAPAWDTILAADIPGSALTKVDDTNVTLTLGGTPSTALLAAASITAGWTGTLAAARLNANVVQGVTNDTNVTGSIATQNLTLSWVGTLAAGRLNANVVQSVVNDTNVTGSIAAQALTLGWTSTLAVGRGGIGVGTLTNHGVLLGQGTSAVVATAVMTDGQILVGQSAADPLPKTLSTDATLAASGALTIANQAVTYAKIQNISATSRFLGRITAGAGSPEELTGTQATTLLDAFTSGLKGLAPASGGGTANFLRADGTWAAAGSSAATTKQYLLSGSGATYTTPANVRSILIQMIGAGGGGGASATNNGGNGGNTIFNSINANGGTGGGNGTAAPRSGGPGGTGGSGTAALRFPGASGLVGLTTLGSGAGAVGLYGMGTIPPPAVINTTTAAPAANTGAGGNGGASGTATGGGGGSGEYVEIVIVSPAATYTYTIGAAGTGAAAGTQAGSNGASGLIMVTEYY